MCQKRTKRRTKAAQTGQKQGAAEEGGRVRRGEDSGETRLTVESGQQSGQATGKGSASEIKAKTIAIQRRNVFAECCTLTRPQLPVVACPKVAVVPHTYTSILPLSTPSSLSCSCWTCAFNLQDTCLRRIEGSSSCGTLSYRVHAGTAYTAQRVQRSQVTH